MEDGVRQKAPVDERDVLRAINKFAIEISKIGDENELYWHVAEKVVGKLGFVDCVVYCFDSKSSLLHQVAAIGDKSPTGKKIENSLTLPLKTGVTGTVAATGVAKIIGDLSKEPAYVQDIVPALSEICVPYFIRGDLGGVIDCESPVPYAFDEFHLEILSTLAAMIGTRLSALREERTVERQNRELKASEERFALAMQGANDGLFDWKVQTDEVYYSPRWFSMLGYAADEFPTRYEAFLSLIHPEDKESVLQSADEAKIGGLNTLLNEFRIRHKDGSWVDILSRAFVVRGNGKTRRVVGTHIDITERKRQDAALRNSENRLREALAVAKLGWWEVDSDGALHWSPEVFDLFGVDPETFKGRPEDFYRLIHPDDLERVLAANHDAIRNRHRYSCVHRVIRGDGVTIHVKGSADLVKVADEEGLRFSGTIQDVSEQVRSEERVRKAQKMEAIGQLTGGIAHDFNNLLAVIQGCSEILEAEQEFDPDMVQSILHASQRGAELTHRLLAYSRQQPLAPKTLNLAELAKGMKALLQRTLGEAIEIIDISHPGLWSARADPGQVEDALLNLAINARDAMPDGGKLIIECENATLSKNDLGQTPDAAPGEYVVLSVTDTGAGMSDQVKAKAFEPFFTTKDVGQGSGLGLSMVYGFAKQSGGHVSIYSEENKGTTIKVYLPRGDSQSSTASMPGAQKSPAGSGETILVLEDDPAVRSLVVRTIIALGYQVLEAEHAAAARDLLENGAAFDLILSDVVLPGGTTGPEFAEEVRKKKPESMIIFMSGYPAEAAKGIDLIESGAVLLSKPFKRAELATALREALDIRARAPVAGK